MKILYHHRATSKHGQAVHIEELIGALRDLGHEIVVVAPKKFENGEFGRSAAVVAGLKRYLPRVLYELAELSYSIIALLRLLKAYRQFRPDVMYERANLFLLAGVWLKRLTRLPLLMEVNTPLAATRAMAGGLALRSLARWAEQSAWRGADVVLPVTHTLAAYVRKVGVPENRIRVIPNGVDPARFDPAAHDGKEVTSRLGLSGHRVLGFTGFVTARHRLDLVIELLADAISAQQSWHLLVVGDGPEVPILRAQARALGVADRLTVTGVIPRERIAAYIGAFDIALQPGAGLYDSPLKLFEYMAMGKAIVAPDMPNIREVLTPDHDAVLFDPSHPEGFKNAILALVNDPTLCARLGATASQTTKRFTWAVNAGVVVRLAEQSLERPLAEA